MLGAIKNNSIVALVVALVLVGTLWAGAWVQPALVGGAMPLMPLEVQWLHGIPQGGALSTALALCGVLLAGLVVYGISGRHFVVSKSYHLPAFFFVLLCSALPMQKHLMGAHISLVLFVLALALLLRLYKESNTYALLFYASILVSLGVLCSVSGVALLPVVPLALLVFGTTFDWRQWAIVLAGTLLPWVYTVALNYVWGCPPLCVADAWLQGLGQAAQPHARFANLPEWAYVGLLLVVLVLVSLSMNRQRGGSKIKTQKIHLYCVCLLVVLMVWVAVLPSVVMPLMLYAAVPMGILLAQYVVVGRPKVVLVVVLLLLLGLLYMVQYMQGVVAW